MKVGENITHIWYILVPCLTITQSLYFISLNLFFQRTPCPISPPMIAKTFLSLLLFPSPFILSLLCFLTLSNLPLAVFPILSTLLLDVFPKSEYLDVIPHCLSHSVYLDSSLVSDTVCLVILFNLNKICI